jgi:uncharacterized protein YacL
MTRINVENKQFVLHSLLCLISFLLLIYVGYEYKSSKTNEIIHGRCKERCAPKSQVCHKKINLEVNSTSSLADGVAKDLSSGKLGNDSMAQGASSG